MVNISKIDVGDRIRVTHLKDEKNEPSIDEGNEGVVDDITEDFLTGKKVWVEFDNGSYIGLLPEDEVEVIG